MPRNIDRAEGIVKPLVPPHNFDVERAVLGAMLLERESVATTLMRLTPADFWKDGHRMIFDAVCGLVERGEPVDLLTVSEELRRHQQLDAVGGPTALALLVEEAAATANMEAYITILREHANRRAIIALGYDLIAHGQNGHPAGDLIALVDSRTEPLKSRSADATVLLDAQLRTDPRQLVEPLVEATGITILFADGGAGKGYVSLVAGLAAASGKPMPAGLRPTQRVPVLLLDYESSQEDVEHRLALLGKGLGMPTAGLIHYRRCSRPLADGVGSLRMEMARLGIGLLIVDSFAPACGPEPESGDSIIRAITAMRGLNVPCLVVAHVSKAMAEQTGRTRPFGSVFAWNLARSCWEVKRSVETETPGEMVLGLFHGKINEGPRRPPFGLRLVFDPPGDEATSVRVEPCPLSTGEDLIRKLGLGQRILTALSTGALTAEELAEALGAAEAVVSRTLRRLRAKGCVVCLDEGGGRGKHARWGLAV